MGLGRLGYFNSLRIIGMMPLETEANPNVLSIFAYSPCAKYARQSATAVMSVASTAAKGSHRKP